jgi:hypothetical protein
VIGYQVSEIYHVITESQRSPSNPVALSMEHQVKVFLHRNVGESAWGIAIHREARLIAISANTHKVIVFAYGLANPSDITDPKTFRPESLASGEVEVDFPHPRWRDHAITLQATTNIPAVSFDQGDHLGRWLFSSSISGENHLWDLYNPQVRIR